MRRWAKYAAIGASVSALLALGTAAIADLLATEVLFISPKAPDVVSVERALWEPGNSVPDIYGTPANQPSRVIGFDESKLVRPKEDRSLLLLKVDKQRGDNPLQVKTVWFVALRVVAGLALVALLSLASHLWLGRKGRQVAYPSRST